MEQGVSTGARVPGRNEIGILRAKLSSYLLSYKSNLSHEAKGSDEVLEGELFENGIRLALTALWGPSGHLGEFISLGISFKLYTRHVDVRSSEKELKSIAQYGLKPFCPQSRFDCSRS